MHILTPQSWAKAQPFPHFVIDGFFPEDVFEEAQETVYGLTCQDWLMYDSPFEKNKSVCVDPVKVRAPRDFCHSPETIRFLERVTGITGLITDPFLHGGGFHKTETMGHLDLHLDYSHHPKLNVERRLTLIVYLSRFASYSEDGCLELWNADASALRSRVLMAPNRAVLFENTEHAIHGHPIPLDEQQSPRMSFACFYHTAPRPDVIPRPRALFFPHPDEPFDPIKDQLRKERAGILS